MLKLTRKTGERVFIRIDGETVAIVSIESQKGNQISVGFEATREVEILREEVLERSKKRD